MNRDCWRASILVCAAALGAAGCASTGPAPVEDRSINPSSRSHAASAAPKTAAPASGTYRVERGDTLYSIAFRHGIDYRELAEWNGIAPPYTIYPGRELRLSSPRGAARPIAQTSSPPPTAPPPPVTRTTQPNPPPFGQLVGGYVAGDPMKQGIDIAGNAGAPVKAAADGTVVYSGNGLIGYGELIIVKHNPAFLSAYGHNRKRLVQEGDRVKAGQTIAEMGSSSANRDELHFEIRRNGKPSNPLDYLPHR